MEEQKWTRETCPKDMRWAEQGGRCGWAHECVDCNESPALRHPQDRITTKTAQEWCMDIHHIAVIMDPDGWRRADSPNFYDDLLTKQEFIERLNQCTLRFKTKAASDHLKAWADREDHDKVRG